MGQSYRGWIAAGLALGTLILVKEGLYLSAPQKITPLSRARLGAANLSAAPSPAFQVTELPDSSGAAQAAKVAAHPMIAKVEPKPDETPKERPVRRRRTRRKRVTPPVEAPVVARRNETPPIAPVLPVKAESSASSPSSSSADAPRREAPSSDSSTAATESRAETRTERRSARREDTGARATPSRGSERDGETWERIERPPTETPPADSGGSGG